MPFEFGQPVDPGAELTQVGAFDARLAGKWMRREFRFQCKLREEEAALSAYVGRLSVDEAIWRITLGQYQARPGDAVRYGTVEALVGAGFSVVHAPDTCEEHVLVQAPGEWDDDAASNFDACFREGRW